MRVIAFLAIVILVAILAGVHKSKYARITIGSIFGLTFFAVWPFLLYTSQLMQWPAPSAEIAFAIACAISVTAAFVLVKIRHTEIVAIATFTTFVVTIMVSWSFDTAIKRQIDNYLYLTPAIVTSDNSTPLQQPVVTFSHPSSGYTFDVPASWKRRDNFGEQFIYFQKMNNSSVDVELRPKCLDKNVTSIGQMVMNIRGIASEEHTVPKIECHKLGNQSTCSVMYKGDDGQLMKLSQFGFSPDMRKGYYLDFILHKPDRKTMRKIEGIISSIRPSPQQNNLQACLGLSSWF